MNRELVIFGCGGHAHSVAEVVLFNAPDTQITFVDPAAQPDETIFGFEIVKPDQLSRDTDKEYFIAIGDNHRRQAQREALGRIVLTRVIAKDAFIGRDADVGAGCFVGHQAFIGPEARIGENSIINTRAIIEHEVRVGKNSQVGPGAEIGGRTYIGNRTFIGLGAMVIDRLTIGSNVTIGAGAVVVESIEQPGTYVGIPAKRVNK